MSVIEKNVVTGEVTERPYTAAEETQRQAFISAWLASFPARAAAEIDAKAGEVRKRYITSVPGQDATYLLKERHAEAYKAAGYAGAVPAMIQAEAAATGLSAQAAADSILAERDAWLTKAAQIEQARRSGKISVVAAATHDQKVAAYQAAIVALDAL